MDRHHPALGAPCSACSSRYARDPACKARLVGTLAAGLPDYVYRPLNGDSFGFYAAAREFISSLGKVSKPALVLAALLVLGAVAGAVVIWRRAPALRWLALLMPPAGVAVALVLPIRQMHPPGAAVFGWSSCGRSR